jgi:uncharacterized membrane protein YedE/YeeE
MYRFLLLGPAFLGWIAVTLQAGLRAGFLLLLGLGFGAALSASRFGFTTGWRNLIVRKDPWGMIGQMIMMAICAVLSFPLLANFGHEIAGAVAPITWGLVIGAVLFGFAMQLADGCGSGTLYKAGASSPTSWVVLPAFIAGSFVGASHQHAWESLGGPLQAIGLQQEAAPIDLITASGMPIALTLTLLGCAAVAAASYLYAKRSTTQTGHQIPAVPSRWVWGAVVIAVLYAIHLVVAGQPWGIVYGLGLWGAKFVTALGADLSADTFWGVAPHIERISEPVLWDVTSVTNIGLLYGALIANRWNTDAITRRSWPSATQLLISIFAGCLMGYSARLAYGCNVGAYLGGVASGRIHGWVWFAFAFLGSIGGVAARMKARIE